MVMHKELTDPKDMVHEQLHVDGICLDLGGKQNEHSNAVVLEGWFERKEPRNQP